ncbi:kynurenine 3-monooxygenase Ecym_7125 [Eremothecium cymbalariae DBVPG|uniref:Kynurenine 3-monooxygenase n=1 Tax=Eremothecium cymbalariae (strain CBS 270.75 / DBVPG 7215 / KCTC 17166 / NRRL Y-17582) TaxID=931890 RepID=G8JVW0_ERECY|nr:hypothetical protein Ecym_7125 [Eremothecium cymbalariae DBVPG\
MVKGKEEVAVIGAGLVGCLAAIGLSKKGYNVSLFDYRSDPRLVPKCDRNLRSINLAISARGITALQYVDYEMSQRLLSDIIPICGRMVHDLKGNLDSQLYGLFGESINSIDRDILNNKLLDEVDGVDEIKLYFGYKLTNLRFSDVKQTAVFTMDGGKLQKSLEFDFIVGCDGAYSKTRYELQREIRMDFSQEYIDCCYLELSIPATKDFVSRFNGHFAISPDYLHIWPRHNYMLMGLPNKDGSFTCTFFGPWSLVESFKSTDEIKNFLCHNFPDVIDLIGLENAVYAFEHKDRGALMCVQCSPQHLDGGRCIILGDASHSMVPFYGQGMNCGFEDVRVLMQLLDKNNLDRNAAFQEYTSSRQKDLLAIVQLAKSNYKDMSHGVISKLHLFKRKLDRIFGRILGNRWVPIYTMVSFRADIPYHVALQVGKKHNMILNFTQALLAGTAFWGALKVLKTFGPNAQKLLT